MALLHLDGGGRAPRLRQFHSEVAALRDARERREDLVQGGPGRGRRAFAARRRRRRSTCAPAAAKRPTRRRPRPWRRESPAAASCRGGPARAARRRCHGGTGGTDLGVLAVQRAAGRAVVARGLLLHRGDDPADLGHLRREKRRRGRGSGFGVVSGAHGLARLEPDVIVFGELLQRVEVFCDQLARALLVAKLVRGADQAGSRADVFGLEDQCLGKEPDRAVRVALRQRRLAGFGKALRRVPALRQAHVLLRAVRVEAAAGTAPRRSGCPRPRWPAPARPARPAPAAPAPAPFRRPRRHGRSWPAPARRVPGRRSCAPARARRPCARGDGAFWPPAASPTSR